MAPFPDVHIDRLDLRGTSESGSYSLSPQEMTSLSLKPRTAEISRGLHNAFHEGRLRRIDGILSRIICAAGEGIRPMVIVDIYATFDVVMTVYLRCLYCKIVPTQCTILVADGSATRKIGGQLYTPCLVNSYCKIRRPLCP